MDWLEGAAGREDAVVDLFAASFADSEGEEEGAVIAGLVRALLRTPPNDLFVFTAAEDGPLLGGIIFSRLSYSEDDRSVFLLAPVAVATAHQGRGVGQTLIAHGLNAMKAAGADIAITYGDPNYYSKTGFRPLSLQQAAPPHPLQQPHGWQGQALAGGVLAPLKGAATCVPAFDDPAFW